MEMAMPINSDGRRGFELEPPTAPEIKCMFCGESVGFNDEYITLGGKVIVACTHSMHTQLALEWHAAGCEI